jgi:hypothetical protein
VSPPKNSGGFYFFYSYVRTIFRSFLPPTPPPPLHTPPPSRGFSRSQTRVLGTRLLDSGTFNVFLSLQVEDRSLDSGRARQHCGRNPSIPIRACRSSANHSPGLAAPSGPTCLALTSYKTPSLGYKSSVSQSLPWPPLGRKLSVKERSGRHFAVCFLTQIRTHSVRLV